MELVVKKTLTKNHYIVVDGKTETVVVATSEENAKLKYMNQSVESVEHKVSAQWGVIRYKREQLIEDTDWTQMTDSPLTTDKKTEFATYRQALRDLPSSTDNPNNIVWPEKPTI